MKTCLEYTDETLIEKYFEADLSPDEQSELQIRMQSDVFCEKINHQHAFNDAVATLVNGNQQGVVGDSRGKLYRIITNKKFISFSVSLAAVLALFLVARQFIELNPIVKPPEQMAEWNTGKYIFPRMATMVEQHAIDFNSIAGTGDSKADYGLSAGKYRLDYKNQAYIFEEWSEEIPCRIYLRGHAYFKIEPIGEGQKLGNIYNSGTYAYFVNEVKMEKGRKMMTVTFNQDMKGEWKLYVDEKPTVSLIFQRP